MKLNENVVIAEFDGGKIILVVDNSEVFEGSVVKAKDLQSDIVYEVEMKNVISKGKNHFDYYLPFKYFEVARKSHLAPLFKEDLIIQKYGLEYGDEVSGDLLLKIEDELNEIKLNNDKKTPNR